MNFNTYSWSLRNPALFRNFAYTISKLRPTYEITSSSLKLDHHHYRRLSSQYDANDNHFDFFDDQTKRQLTAISSSSSVAGGGSSGSKLVVYYSRRSSSTLHGRVIPKENEMHLIETIKNVMRLNHRPEEFYIFNGEDAEGRKLSYENQFRIFRRATLIVGPHGSGLANILWLSPSIASSGNCDAAPIVFEIIADTTTSKNGVQTGGSMKSYFNLMGGMPWVRYYHMFLAHNSTNEAIYIDFNILTESLNTIFKLLPKNSNLHEQKELNSNMKVLMPSTFTTKSSSSSPSSNQGSKGGTSTQKQQIITTKKSSDKKSINSLSALAPPPSRATADMEAALGITPLSHSSSASVDASVGPRPKTSSSSSAIPTLTLVLAAHKTGSTFLRKVFMGITERLKQCFVELDEITLPASVEDLLTVCPQGGVLFGRKIPNPNLQRHLFTAMETASPDTCRGIFQIRNPYDTAVSQFQSFTKNHVIPASLSTEKRNAEILKRREEHEAGVDAYATKHFSEIKARLENARDASNSLANTECLAMTSMYEDMTVRPELWAAQIAHFLNLSPSTNAYDYLIKLAAAQRDIKPDDKTHTAYFLPGSHLKLLQPSTLNRLY